MVALFLIDAPAHASVMGVQMFVDGRLVATQTAEPNPEGPVPVSLVAHESGFQVDGLALLDVDPFITYGFSIVNFLDTPQQFSVVFGLPYTMGPYDTLLSEFQSTVNDSGDGSVTVVPTDPSGLTAIPQLDGVNVLGGALGGGCSVTGAPFFTDETCEPFSTSAANVVAPADGLLAVTVAFSLSGGDTLNFGGRVEITRTAVPEPVSMAVLGVGLAAITARRRLVRRPTAPARRSSSTCPR